MHKKWMKMLPSLHSPLMSTCYALVTEFNYGASRPSQGRVNGGAVSK